MNSIYVSETLFSVAFKGMSCGGQDTLCMLMLSTSMANTRGYTTKLISLHNDLNLGIIN